MQISEEIFQNILEQPDPVDLSRLTPYCSDFTLDAFSQYRKHFKNTRGNIFVTAHALHKPYFL